MVEFFIFALLGLAVYVLVKGDSISRYGGLIGAAAGLLIGSSAGLSFSGTAVNGAFFFCIVGGIAGAQLAPLVYPKLKRLHDERNGSRSNRVDEIRRPDKEIAGMADHSDVKSSPASGQMKSEVSWDSVKPFFKVYLGGAAVIAAATFGLYLVGTYLLATAMGGVGNSYAVLILALLASTYSTLSFLVSAPLFLFSKRVRSRISSSIYLTPLSMFLFGPAIVLIIFLILGVLGVAQELFVLKT